MKTKTSKAQSIDQYIAAFPEDTQALLQKLRDTIRKAAPRAEETISYAIPAFKQNGTLVYFAGYKKHIGFYPTASGIEAFQKELGAYKSSRGAVQFPLDEPLPLALITKVVKFRLKQSTQLAAVEKQSFLSSLSAPAARALHNKGITTLKQLAKFSEAEILALHGMGPGSLPKLRSALKAEKLSFRKK